MPYQQVLESAKPLSTLAGRVPGFHRALKGTPGSKDFSMCLATRLHNESAVFSDMSGCCVQGKLFVEYILTYLYYAGIPEAAACTLSPFEPCEPFRRVQYVYLGLLLLDWYCWLLLSCLLIECSHGCL